MSYDLQVLNGDLVISSTADLATTQGNPKLIQDLLKIAITAAGSNPLQPWYGSLVSKTLIGSYLSSDIVISTAQSQLQNAIENLQNLQNLQVQSGQTVTPDEQISFINDISITRSTVDPRLFSVIIMVLSKSFGKVAASFTASNT